MRLRTVAVEAEGETIKGPLQSLEDAARKIEKAWSGSALGYHSLVYHENFSPPPPGSHFSREWGLYDGVYGTRGRWKEYSREDVLNKIDELAGNRNIEDAENLSTRATVILDESRSEFESILSTRLSERDDNFLLSFLSRLEKTQTASYEAIVARFLPRGRLMSRDALAAHAGIKSAPHQEVLARVFAARSPIVACNELALLCEQAASHTARIAKREVHVITEKTVFIGHGRSLVWRELKDFLDGRLHLPWDEFNRVPVAGVTNIARLTQMLTSAGIAFLILTAEDERIDGAVLARQNVIHEAGLFQGKLGFSRGILMIEEGCEEFSNVAGLGQIRFPAGKISAAFEEVRLVLEREGFLS